MPTARSIRNELLYSVSIFIVLLLLAGGMAIYVFSDPAIRQANVLPTAAYRLKQIYGEELNWDSLIVDARNAMIDRLDRYSDYMAPEEFAYMDEELSGAYGGIGVTIINHDSGLLVMSVREGGPADQVGMLTGDIITQADSISLANLSATESSALLRGEAGTEVMVSIYRPSTNDTLEMTVTRERVDLLHVPFAGYTPDSVIYIRLLDFQSGASTDIESALDSLLEMGDPRGIILDLRSNPGGLFVEAFRTANLFLEDGQLIVGTDARSAWEENKYYSSGDDVTGGLPMAVIVDRGSASSSEIVAGALGQLDRAIIVGDTTFGKGLVQGFSRFPDGGGLRLTISRYYLSGDFYLNEFDSVLNDTGHGIPPDVYFDFVELDEFPRELERSLLLQEFAHQNEEAIIQSSAQFGLPDVWVRRFRDFARQQGFDYTSSRTEAATELVELAALENYPEPAIRKAEQILKFSKQRDAEQFDDYSGFIKRRLRQIAWERRFGTYQAYRDVIVPYRPDIQLAADLLLNPNIAGPAETTDTKGL